MTTAIKHKQRLFLQQQRAQLSATETSRLNQAIIRQLTALDEFKQAQHLFSYVSTGSEVDTHGLLNDLLSSTKQVSVPHIVDKRCMQAVLLNRWADLTPAEMGILTVKSGEVVTDNIDLAITPGLGFSPSRQRLGYGKGYYDRWFSEHPSVCRVGLCYNCQILPDLAHDAMDIPMDILITETQVIRR